MSCHTTYGPLLRSLHWLPVRQRINFKLAKLCYLATSFQQQGYLADLISLACCDHPHRSFCQFHRTTWTLLLVLSLLLLRDFGTLFHWIVELLHPLTHLRSVLRHFSLIRHNCTVARACVLWHDRDWKWPCLTKYTHLQVVCLILEGRLVMHFFC